VRDTEGRLSQARNKFPSSVSVKEWGIYVHRAFFGISGFITSVFPRFLKYCTKLATTYGSSAKSVLA
jgi:hypothetical protein